MQTIEEYWQVSEILSETDISIESKYLRDGLIYIYQGKWVF